MREHVADEQDGRVYGRRSDMWTNRALDLLARERIAHAFIDLDEPANAKLANELIRDTRRYQTPYVYLRGELIGGFAELDELARLGQLDVRLGRQAARPGRIDVVVAPREQEFVPPALVKPPRD